MSGREFKAYVKKRLGVPTKKKAATAPKSHTWRTFLKIDSALLGDTPPAADAAWLAARGMEESAPVVLELLRRHVVQFAKDYFEHTSLWFLVHNRESGVPADDKAAYLDITISFAHPIVFTPCAPFVMTQPAELSKECAGWDLRELHHGILSVRRLLNLQTGLLLAFIDSFEPSTETFVMLKHLRQYMHYFSNQSQMRIS
jgi:hypothetical protein